MTSEHTVYPCDPDDPPPSGEGHGDTWPSLERPLADGESLDARLAEDAAWRDSRRWLPVRCFPCGGRGEREGLGAHVTCAACRGTGFRWMRDGGPIPC